MNFYEEIDKESNIKIGILTKNMSYEEAEKEYYRLKKEYMKSKTIFTGNRKSLNKFVKNRETGEIFESLKKGGQKYGISLSCMSQACKKGTTAGGYHWEKIDIKIQG